MKLQSDGAVRAPDGTLRPAKKATFPQAVEKHGDEDDSGKHDRLKVEVDPDEDHARSDHLHQHRADDRAEGGADATEEAGAAEDGSRDHVELLADTEGLIEPAYERDQQHAAKGGTDPRDVVHREQDASRVDARLPCGLDVVADRIELTAEGGSGKDDVGGSNSQREDDDRDRNAEDRSRAEGEKGGRIVDPERLGDGGDEAVAGDHRRQRHQKRRDGKIDDAEGVDRSERRPGRQADDEAREHAERPLQAGDPEQVADGHRRHVHDGPDRKVDPGGEQHEGHADREDPDERPLLDDVEDVLTAASTAIRWTWTLAEQVAAQTRGRVTPSTMPMPKRSTKPGDSMMQSSGGLVIVPPFADVEVAAVGAAGLQRLEDVAGVLVGALVVGERFRRLGQELREVFLEPVAGRGPRMRPPSNSAW